MTNRLAIIRNPRLVFGDRTPIELHFETYIDETGAALQVIPWDAIESILVDAGTLDVKDLDRRACYVADTPGIIRFIRLAKI